MKGLGSIHFLSTALMAITINFVGAAMESAQAQSAANITTVTTQQYSAQDEAKRRLVLKFYQAFNTGNTALIDEAFADNWVDYHPSRYISGEARSQGYCQVVSRHLPGLPG